ncbi:MAG: ABC transporter permease subunit [Dehalococcoidia bacterium]
MSNRGVSTQLPRTGRDLPEGVDFAQPPGVIGELIGTGGRINRLGFFARLTGATVVFVSGLLLFDASSSFSPLSSLAFVYLGFAVLFLSISIAVSAAIRRTHDIGWNGALGLLVLIPPIGFFFGLFLLYRRGPSTTNSHGRSPAGLNVGASISSIGISPISQAWHRLRRKKIAMATLSIILVIYAIGILAKPLSTHSYSQTDLLHTQEGPNSGHVLGTDRIGRDIYTRVIWGVQTTVLLTIITVGTGGIILGVTLGMVAGYFGGKTDAVIMRVGEVVAAFPGILLVILIAATLRPRIVGWTRDFEDWSNYPDWSPFGGLIESGFVDYLVVTIALLPFAWYGMMRLVRGQVLALRNADYIEAARAVGVSTPRLLFSHILPNITGTIIVTASASMGAIAGSELILSFLGIGVQPPRPSLGFMISDVSGRGTAVVSVIQQHPEQLLAPIAVIWLLIFTWSLLGDALNDVFNPRTR